MPKRTFCILFILVTIIGTSSHGTALGATDTQQTQDLLQAATEAKSAKQYEKALKLYEQLLVLKEEEFGLEHRDVADVLTSLADMSADEFDDYAKALEYNKRALAIRIKTFGENNENTANSLNRIAIDYFYLKDYPNAKEYFERTLSVRKKILGGDAHEDIASSLKNLGVVYGTTKDYPKAKEYYEMALEVYIELFGETHKNVANSLMTLGEICREMNDYEKAKECDERSLTILKTLGDEPIKTASALHNLALDYRSLNDRRKSAEYEERALALREKELGDHKDTAFSLNYLGLDYYALKDYEKAVEYGKRTVEVYEKLFGKEHLNMAVVLSNLGDSYQSLKNYEKAIECHKQALAIFEKRGGENHELTAGCLVRLGDDYDKSGDGEKSLEYYKRALSIYENLSNNHPEAARVLNNIGVAYRNMGFVSKSDTRQYFEKAKEFDERAVMMRIAIYGEENINTANSTKNLAFDYHLLNAYKTADNYYQRALVIRKKLLGDEHPGIASDLDNMAQNCISLNDLEKAREYSELALSIREKTLGNWHPDTASSLVTAGHINALLGNKDKDLEYNTRALAIREKIFGEYNGDTAISLNNVGMLYADKGLHEDAIDYLNRALKIREKINPKGDVYTIIAYRNLMDENYLMNNFEETIRLGERLLSSIPEENIHAARYVAIAQPLVRSYMALGNYAYAFEVYKKAMERLKTSLSSMRVEEMFPGFFIDAASMTSEINALFRANTTIRLDKDMLQIIQSVVKTLESIGNKRIDQTKALAALYGITGDTEKSVAIYEEVLARHAKNSSEWNEEAGNLATTYYLAKNYDKAKEFYAQVIANTEGTNWMGLLHNAALYDHLADIYLHTGENEKARELYEKALVIYFYANDTSKCRRVLQGLLKTCNALGRKDEAIFYGKMAVNYTQSARSNITVLEEDLQKSFIGTHENLYRDLADILLEQGRILEAQQVLSMLKEEEFFDFIRQDVQSDPIAVSASYATFEEKHVKRFQEICTRLTNDNVAFGKEMENFFDSLDVELKNADGREAELARMNSGESFENLRSSLKETGHGATLLQTIVTNERVWLIFTTPSEQIAKATVISKSELNKKIRDFRKGLETPGNVVAPVAQELYKIIIEPVKEILEKNRSLTLMFSPDGSLRYIPISALHDGEGWLVEKYAVVNYTEAIKERFNYKRAVDDWQMAGLGVTKEHPGFSALPAVRNELESIVSIGSKSSKETTKIHGIIRLDETFTRSELTKALADKSVPLIHIASHFKFTSGTIADSFLLLGDGNHLTLEDIYNRKLRFENVEQLTLSACNTAMGFGEGAGREIEGFGVLAQKNGAKSVMATLWAIADESTGIFMPLYYTTLQKEGLSKTEALRRAQLNFIKGGDKTISKQASPTGTFDSERGRIVQVVNEDNVQNDYSHPYFWAPFILMGNWL